MKRKIKYILTFFCLVIVFIYPILTLTASSASDNLKKVGAGSTNPPYQNIITGQNDLAGIIGLVVQVFLGLLGVIFLIYMIYGGYNWMIAQGEEEKVTKAKETIQRAVVGLIITIAAYAITYWVFYRLIATTNILL